MRMLWQKKKNMVYSRGMKCLADPQASPAHPPQTSPHILWAMKTAQLQYKTHCTRHEVQCRDSRKILAYHFFFLPSLCLCCCAQEILLNVVPELLIVVASLIAEHGRQRHRTNSCGTQAPLLHGMWNLPRPGIKPMFPALTGIFLTTGPQGNSLVCHAFLLTHNPRGDYDNPTMILRDKMGEKGCKS